MIEPSNTLFSRFIYKYLHPEPFVSKHFNIEVEIPLKVIIKGYSYAVIPNTWRNRDEGVTKFKIKEMGSKYFYTLYLCLYEKFFKKNKL